jgi:NTE family protein
VPPLCPLNVSSSDFTHSGQLIDRAAKSTRRWLDEGGLSMREVPGALRSHAHRREAPWSSMPAQSMT